MVLLIIQGASASDKQLFYCSFSEGGISGKRMILLVKNHNFV